MSCNCPPDPCAPKTCRGNEPQGFTPVAVGDVAAQLAQLQQQMTQLLAPPLVSSQPRFRIAVLADHGDTNPNIVKAIQQVQAMKPDLAVHNGDVNYGAHDVATLRGYMDPWLAVAPRHAFTIGNHDRTVADPSGELLRSTYPQFMGPDILRGRRDRMGLPYYAIDLDKELGLDCKLIFVDSNIMSGDPTGAPVMSYGNDAGSIQGVWARDEVLNSNRSLLFSHHGWRSRLSPQPTDRWFPKLHWYRGAGLTAAFTGHEHVGYAHDIDTADQTHLITAAAFRAEAAGNPDTDVSNDPTGVSLRPVAGSRGVHFLIVDITLNGIICHAYSVAAGKVFLSTKLAGPAGIKAAVIDNGHDLGCLRRSIEELQRRCTPQQPVVAPAPTLCGQTWTGRVFEANQPLSNALPRRAAGIVTVAGPVVAISGVMDAAPTSDVTLAIMLRGQSAGTMTFPQGSRYASAYPAFALSGQDLLEVTVLAPTAPYGSGSGAGLTLTINT